MIWRRFMFQHWMTHVVPDLLVPGLLADLESRGGAALAPIGAEYDHENPAVVTSWALDVGGRAFLHEPVEEATIDGLRLELPSRQLPAILARLHALPRRRFACGAAYFKLKPWLHAVVMTPDQHANLLALLQDRAGHAAIRARLFQEAMIRGIAQGVS